MQPLSWYLVAGIVLCAMAIAATVIRRLPLSSAMLYLPIGWALGPHGLNAFHLNILNDAAVVEQITKAITVLRGWSTVKYVFAVGATGRIVSSRPLA